MNNIVVNPKIKNRIKLIINDARQDTKKDLGEKIAKNLQQIHDSVKRQIEDGVGSVIRQVLTTQW